MKGRLSGHIGGRAAVNLALACLKCLPDLPPGALWASGGHRLAVRSLGVIEGGLELDIIPVLGGGVAIAGALRLVPAVVDCR